MDRGSDRRPLSDSGDDESQDWDDDDDEVSAQLVTSLFDEESDP